MTSVKMYDVVRTRRDPESAEATDVWKDFELRDSGIEPSLGELDNPRVSLFSIDLETASMVFVEALAQQDLAREPFSYMAQRKRARRVLTVDFETFFRLYSDSAIPPKQLLHLYSVGRCGSTVLHHALNRVDGVVSLSEPDFLFQLAVWRKTGRIGMEQATNLARASLRCLWRQRPDRCNVLAIKHRGKGIWAFREFREAGPGARVIFLYRNAVDTIQSFDRAANYPHGRRQRLFEVPILSSLIRRGIRLQARRGGVDHYREHLSFGDPADIVAQAGPAGYLLLEWISKMDCYLRLRELDRDCVALRYEDMVAAPEAALKSLLAACGLIAGDIDRVAEVFARDSQEGTALQRSTSRHYLLNEATIRKIRSTIREQTRLPIDLRLPGTVGSEE